MQRTLSTLRTLSVLLLSMLLGSSLPGSASELVDHLIDLGEPQPVTAEGPYAGYIATPQLASSHPTTAFLIAPNRQWLIGYSGDAEGVRIIDMRTGVKLRTLRSNGHVLTGLAISRDSQIIEALDENGGTLGWHAATGEKLDREALKTYEGGIEYVAIIKLEYSPNGQSSSISQWDDPKAIPEFLKAHNLSDQFKKPEEVRTIIQSTDRRYD